MIRLWALKRVHRTTCRPSAWSLQETLVQALQRLFKGRSAEEIGKPLNGLPSYCLAPCRRVRARQIRLFLESQGAILKITYSLQPLWLARGKAKTGNRGCGRNAKGLRERSAGWKGAPSLGFMQSPDAAHGCRRILDRSFRSFASISGLFHHYLHPPCPENPVSYLRRSELQPEFTTRKRLGDEDNDEKSQKYWRRSRKSDRGFRRHPWAASGLLHEPELGAPFHPGRSALEGLWRFCRSHDFRSSLFPGGA